ncbi:MAG: sigma-70 family RNA polymerase sigma factor [Acidobacteria bacterium]|nr:sigma-70 family RNA polymerase sigma factor [Acidobacteriota bacterium]MBI3655930.1 sigma-70 family RNA polymerase sigma factor [Acidobacteriota bacterium]
MIKQSQAGDEVAFESLVRKYQQVVLNLVYHFTGGRADMTEDVAQKVFIKLYLSLPKFKVNRPFFPWLYRITANQCYDELRKIKRNRVLTFTELRADDHAAQDRLMNMHRLPPENGEHERLAQLLAKLMDTLPKQYRTALVLRDIEELPYEEIGAVFRCSVQAARLKVFRARLQMRRALRKLLKPVDADQMAECGTEGAGEKIYALYRG